MSYFSKISAKSSLLKLVLVFAPICGLLTAIITSLLFWSLQWFSHYRETHLWIYFLLPIGGLVTIFIYDAYAQESKQGANFFLNQAKEFKGTESIRWIPFIMLFSLLAHFLGASVGREGVAIQIGGAIACLLISYALDSTFSSKGKQILLLAGLGAGFTTAVSSVIAGMIFAFEFSKYSWRDSKAIVAVCVACLAALYWNLSEVVPVPHLQLPKLQTTWSELLQWRSLAALLLMGVVCGRTAALFSYLLRNLGSKFKGAPKYLFSFFCSLLLVAIFFFPAGRDFSGLGIPFLGKAFEIYYGPLQVGGKFIATVLSLLAGFKGGEFTPLLCVSGALGSFISSIFALPPAQMATLGLVAVYGAAAKIPLTSAVLVASFFGWTFFPGALVVCFIAQAAMRREGIFSAQDEQGSLKKFWRFYCYGK